ncbi:MAG TPA: S41 family peptidase [Candidatus Saccharimonadia bacterium]|nr:S41 family peptidase [Candidatus Saccharimonadia bacterium]
MKKLEFSPLVLIPSVVVIAFLAFFAGDALHEYVTLPFLPAPSNLDFSSLNDLYSLMQQHFDGPYSASAAINGAKAGLVAAGGDPYTEYFTPTQATTLNSDLADSLSGIGAEIGIKNSALTIISPIAGTPAAKAGLQAGDVIEDINNKDTTNMNVDNAVDLIRGKAGTTVTLRIERSGLQEPLKVTITRAQITVPSVTWSLKNGDVGYINISQFTPDTASLMGQAATKLKAQGATKIVLDLRNNPGGYLDAGVAVASEFLNQGTTIVSERTDGKTIDTLTAASGGQLIGFPTVVLINDGSASASEIVSAALHDNHAAKLVGEQSFGKGSVQEIKSLPGGAELKITIAHWYTPDGININKEGIAPDVVVPLTTDEFNAGQDPQLDQALSMLK